MLSDSSTPTGHDGAPDDASSDLEAIFGPPISTYSRAEAIEDGTLVDVSDAAREAGVKVPCAMTRAAYEDIVAWDASDTERTGTPQDESGRLWDVVWMFSRSARGSDGDRTIFSLYVVPRDCGGMAKQRELLAVIGPGDMAEPVITIMLPDES